jgi:hypothetical protein
MSLTLDIHEIPTPKVKPVLHGFYTSEPEPAQSEECISRAWVYGSASDNPILIILLRSEYKVGDSDAGHSIYYDLYYRHFESGK